MNQNKTTDQLLNDSLWQIDMAVDWFFDIAEIFQAISKLSAPSSPIKGLSKIGSYLCHSEGNHFDLFQERTRKEIGKTEDEEGDPEWNEDQRKARLAMGKIADQMRGVIKAGAALRGEATDAAETEILRKAGEVYRAIPALVEQTSTLDDQLGEMSNKLRSSSELDLLNTISEQLSNLQTLAALTSKHEWNRLFVVHGADNLFMECERVMLESLDALIKSLGGMEDRS